MAQDCLKVLYVLAAPPGDNASTIHATSIAELMGMCGCAVLPVSLGIYRRGAGQKLVTKYRSLCFNVPRALGFYKWQVIAKRRERKTSALAIRVFRDIYSRSAPDVVIYYGVTSLLAKAILAQCNDDGVAVIVDETDWFKETDSEFEKDRNNRFERIDPDADGIIAISPFLYDHFSMNVAGDGKPVVFFMPPLNPRERPCVTAIKPREIQRETTRFLYAGSIGGGKDQIVGFIRAILDCGDDLPTEPEMDVVGVTEKEAREALGFLPSLEKVRFHGRQPHEKVIELLDSADFGVLFRKPETYARAGFSTKFAECMSCGVPMICNSVGGADAVIDPDVDGIVIPDLTKASMVHGLAKACGMDEKSLNAMKQAALGKARDLFGMENYQRGFSSFLEKVQKAASARERGNKRVPVENNTVGFHD